MTRAMVTTTSLFTDSAWCIHAPDAVDPAVDCFDCRARRVHLVLGVPCGESEHGCAPLKYVRRNNKGE
jgi:hypothetical protein